MTDLLVDDFSGGMTDIYIDGPKEAGHLFDNLLIDIHGKVYQRPGSVVLPGVSQVPSGATRLSQLWIWRLSLSAPFAYVLGFSNTKLYYSLAAPDAKGRWAPGSWSEVTGPVITGSHYSGGNVALATASSARSFLTSGSANSRIYPFANGTDHYLVPGTTDITDDNKAFLLRKLYIGTDGAIKLTMAGLPAIDGGALTGAPVPTVGTAGTAHTYLYAFVLKHTYQTKSVSTGVTYIVRSPVYLYPTAVTTLNPIGVIANDVSWALPLLFNSAASPNPTMWDLDNIVIEIYRTKDAGQVFYKVQEVNMGAATSDDQVTDANLGEPLYTNGGSSDTSEPGAARFGVLANDSNWFSGMGPNPFSATETFANNVVLQGIPGAKDTASDDYLTTIEEAVTGLGKIDIYPLVFCESSCYRLEGILDAQGRGSTVIRPISTKIGSVSHDGIVNLGRYILFPSLRGFYMTDGYDVQPISEHLLTRYAKWTATKDQKTSISGRFDVKTNQVFWTMKSYGVLASNLSDNDMLLVLDLNKPMTKTSCFTAWNGGRYPANFAPTSICPNEGYLLRGDSRGYLMQHDDCLNTDPSVNTGTVYTSWGAVAVFYNYISCAYAFGTQRLKKWATWIMATFLNEAVYSSYDHNFDTATINVVDPANPFATMNSGGGANYFFPSDCVSKYISFSGDNYTTAYLIIQLVNVGGVYAKIFIDDPQLTAASLGVAAQNWVIRDASGKVSCQINSMNEMKGIWKSLKLVSLRAKTANDNVIKRFFPPGGLRFTYKQVQFTNGYDIMKRSDDYATITITGTVATLTSGVFTREVTGLYLHRKVGGVYEDAGVLVTWSAGGTVNLASAPGNGTFAWYMKGYPTDEKFKLQGYTIPVNTMGESIAAFTKAEGDTNA